MNVRPRHVKPRHDSQVKAIPAVSKIQTALVETIVEELKLWPEDLSQKIRMVTQLGDSKRIGDRGEGLDISLQLVCHGTSQKRSSVRRTYLGSLTPLEKTLYIV